MKIERLSAKVEDYLETILRLSETPRGARTGDIAAALNVQPSTVSAALKSLTEQGSVSYTHLDVYKRQGSHMRPRADIANGGGGLRLTCWKPGRGPERIPAR